MVKSLQEDPSSSPSTHVGWLTTTSSKSLMPSSGLHGHCTHMYKPPYTYTYSKTNLENKTANLPPERHEQQKNPPPLGEGTQVGLHSCQATAERKIKQSLAGSLPHLSLPLRSLQLTLPSTSCTTPECPNTLSTLWKKLSLHSPHPQEVKDPSS